MVPATYTATRGGWVEKLSSACLFADHRSQRQGDRPCSAHDLPPQPTPELGFLGPDHLPAETEDRRRLALRQPLYVKGVVDAAALVVERREVAFDDRDRLRVRPGVV